MCQGLKEMGFHTSLAYENASEILQPGSTLTQILQSHKKTLPTMTKKSQFDSHGCASSGTFQGWNPWPHGGSRCLTLPQLWQSCFYWELVAAKGVSQRPTRRHKKEVGSRENRPYNRSAQVYLRYFVFYGIQFLIISLSYQRNASSFLSCFASHNVARSIRIKSI